MRILVLNYEFPPIGGGGGRASQDICRVLAERGHQVRIQTAWVKGVPHIEEHNGYTVYRAFSFRRRADRCTVPEMGGFVLMNLVPTLKHIQQWHPHLLHVHFAVPTGAVALAANLMTGIPYVLTVHLGDVPGSMPGQTDYLYRIFKPLTVPIWQRAAAVTAVSEYVRQIARQSYDVPVETLHNGIDINTCYPGSLAPHRPIRLIFAGRLDPQKNIPFLVDVLARVSDINWRLDIAGDGPQMDLVKRKISESRLSERIHLHGWIDPASVDMLLAQSDILVLPSSFEGMPVVGVKGLNYGLAILGSNIGGLQDIVEDGCNGFLCPANDLGAFEQVLRAMLSDLDKLASMKRRSRQMAARFDINNIVDRYETIFEEAASAIR